MKGYTPNECSPARPAIIRLPDTPVPLSAFGPANVQWTTVREWFCLSVAVFASVFASLRVSLSHCRCVCFSQSVSVGDRSDSVCHPCVCLGFSVGL